jgi:outer membrane protein, heavy metal efflux system
VTRLAILALSLALAGCAVPKEAGFPDVARAVAERSGQSIHWNQGGPEDAAIEARVKAMLARAIGADEAVQIALFQNCRLQATYEDLMIAQADLVQAGLLRNPAFFASVRVPAAGSGSPDVELSVEQDFLDLILLPSRKRLAASAFEAQKLRVSAEVLQLAADVRAAYYTLQGAQQLAAMRRAIVEASEASVEIARRQHDAGNISDLDLASEEALSAQIRLDLARSEAEILSARERLGRLLGVWGDDARFRIHDKLPDLPAEDPPLDRLESLAMGRRLDVAAARQDVQTSSHALALAENGRWLGGAGLGADVERGPGGEVIAGPTARVELPIFDQHQAEIARREADLRRARARLAALAVEARSEVREARGRVIAARDVAAHYRATVIPLRERIVALSQQHYDAMLLGVYQLLAAKQAEVNAYREYIEAVRDYWIARSELERATGGRVEPPIAAAPSPPPRTP